MATSDLTRDIFDPRKQYRSLRLQQGRVLSDDDPNEAERIRLEDERRARLEIVGPYGSPDEGFRVGEPGFVDGAVDFPIGAGSLWVGGIRFEKSQAERYREQADWLTNPLSDSGEGGVPAPQGERADLVYVECWLQPVSAVEDSELFEVALGGPDTSTRLKAMCRVRVRAEVETGDCATAWTNLVDALEAEGRGSVNEEHELVVDTRLDVGFEEGEDGDLCTPAVAEGYLGAENQAIRVELLEDERIVWGFDNGAPLYRARQAADADSEVVLLTDPKDRAHRPRAGQIVELLPWGAVLVNGEKVADDLDPGFFAFVESYDPETGRLALNRSLTAGDDFLERANRWRDRGDADELLETRFGRDAIPDDGFARFFVRVWDQGPVRNGDGPGAGDVPGLELDGGPVSLTGTGLTVEVLGDDYRPGDHWIVSARPDAPDRVVPWELQREDDGGRRPHGVRRFYAPLAVIDWNVGEPGAHVVHDCRPPFRPLTETGGCCRFSVGDGVRSHGHFRSVQRAVNALPPKGGEICLLPGVHEASVSVDDRENVVIRGCGKQTRVVPDPRARSAPIFHVRDSRCVVLERMDLATFTGSAVVLESSEPGALREVDVLRNRVQAFESGISVHGGTEIRIRENRIRMLDKEEAGVGVYSRADRCAIEENDVGVVPAEEEPPPVEDPDGDTLDPADRCEDPERLYGSFDFLAGYLDWLWALPLADLLAVLPEPAPFRALGGIQVAAGSSATRVRDNRILGGAGDGVRLGGARAAPVPESAAVGSPEFTVSHPDGLGFEGQVLMSERDAVEGVDVVFAPTGGEGRRVIGSTGRTGRYSTPGAAGGEYSVTISDPGYLVTRVIEGGQGTAVDVTQSVDVFVEERERETDDPLRPLHDIEITRNRIQRMGLSGIGTAEMPSETLEDFSNEQGLELSFESLYEFGVPVQGLDILANRITRCLQSSDFGPRRGAAGLGLGGISVGTASTVTVRDNVIERNGISHLVPVCGVYLGYATGVEISDNRILDNGPVREEEADGELDRGVRGGVVVGFVAPPSEAVPHTAAASIANNVVSQPAGRALTILLAVGSISVRGNQFEAAGRAENELDELVGAVLLMNLGVSETRRRNLGRPAQGAASVSRSAIGFGAFRLASLSRQMRLGGDVDFSHNQVRLGRKAESRLSQLIVSLDDVAYSSNQCISLARAGVAFEGVNFDVLLSAATLRVLGNRFREPAWASADAVLNLSLWSLASSRNDTSHNQADYCILPQPSGGLVFEGNQDGIVGSGAGITCDTLRA